MTSTRQLAAIMFTDIVGYTALMGSDEVKAFEVLQRNRETHNQMIPEYNGRIIKEMGDGMLISFNLATDAVKCATQLQNKAKDLGIPLKIGIHQGEVVFDGDDVFGDGVNIASRIQENCESGCINISGRINSDVKNIPEIRTLFLKEQQFKNVEETIKVYQVLTEEDLGNRKPDSFRLKTTSRRLIFLVSTIPILIAAAYLVWRYLPFNNTSTIEREKSIAIMPFDNESTDEENEYFVNGMMEDIRNNLAIIGDLKVISKTSTARYKETILSSIEIGNELSVNYLLEGTVQKLGNKVKIHAQLIDAESDDHLWQDTYQRDLGDIKEIFNIQAEIAQSIAGQMNAVITPEENNRMASIPTDNAEAYDFYLQADWNSNADVERSIVLLEKAIELDPEFADAYALLGFLKSQFWWFGKSKMTSSEEAYKTAIPYYEKALRIDPDNVNALERLVSALVLYKWDFKKAERKMEILKKLDPYTNRFIFLIPFGRFKEALQEMESLMKKDPYSVYSGDKIMCYYFNNMEAETFKVIEDVSKGVSPHLDMDITRTYLFYDKNNEALALLEYFFENFQDFKETPRPLGFLAIAYWRTGKFDKSREILKKLTGRSKESSAGSPSYYLTQIYAQMGEIDLAFQSLEKAYQDREVEMYWLKVVPLFKPLHSDSRWQEMLNKVGFPD